MLDFPCAKCGQPLSVPEGSARGALPCPRCGLENSVPTSSPVAYVSGSPSDVAPAGSTEPVTAVTRRPDSSSPLLHQGRQAEFNPKITAGFGAIALPSDTKDVYDFLAPPQETNEIGRLGPYRVHRVLGTGGMGIVFQAEDAHLQRLVALKVLKPALAANASFRQRFLLEARAMAAIKNDHIVNIHQVGLDGGVPFLAMEFLEGETLDHMLERLGRLPLAEVLRVGREAAEGLAAAHARQLVHRDIKPANIWLEAPRGRVKILDFGLARGTGDNPNLTETGLILGTPFYMAPEQARGLPIDGRCDLFSLGCVLYKAASGVLPFTGADTMSVLSALALHDPAPLIDLDPDLPAELSDLVGQLLAKDPADRPASAQFVVEVLDAIERELPVEKKLSNSARVALGQGAAQAATPVRLSSSTTTSVRGSHRPRRYLVYSLGGVIGLAALLIVLALGAKHFPQDATSPDSEDFVQAELDTLQQRLDDPKASRDHLRQDLLVFIVTNPATPQAVKAAEWLKQLPSPLDDLDPSKIPDDERDPRIHDLVGVLSGHVGPVWSVVFSPDGKKLASGGGGGTDHSVRLWDLAGPEPKAGPVLRGHDSTVTGVSFTPNGKRLASSSMDGTVRLWTVADRPTTPLVLRGDGPPIKPILCVSVSPDGKLLACGEGHDVRLWDISNDKAPVRRDLLKGHSNQVNSVAFSRDGKLLASGGADQTVLLWDLSDKAPKRKHIIKGQTSGVTSVAFTRNGRTLATGSADQTVWLWSLAGKGPHQQTTLEGHTNKVNSVTFAPDDKSLLSAGNDGGVILWNMPAGNKLREWQFPEKEIVHRAAFSPGGRHLAVAHDNGKVYILRLPPAEK